LGADGADEEPALGARRRGGGKKVALDGHGSTS
jgi:hypothetical protein